MSRSIVIILLTVVLAVLAYSTPQFRTTKGKKIFQQYVTKFKDGYDVESACLQMNRHFRNFGYESRIRHIYKAHFHGASVQDVPPGALQWIMRQDFIEFVEEVGIFHAVQSVGPDPDPVSMSSGNYVNWGLDRITERTYTSDYIFNPMGHGDDIDIFVLDTGLRQTHLEFETRADALILYSDPQEGEDCNGHGTQTSGVASGLKFGTATKANIISVKVLNCNGEGTSDDVLAGLEAIKTAKPNGTGVVSLSISSDDNFASIYQSIVDLTVSGFVVVAAAGNSNDDACFHYPAGYSEVLTVGAINAKGKLTSFSNFGPCVDIYAPGSNIYTATNEGDDQIKKMKGTSFAAPFASGAAAILLQQSITPSAVIQTIIDMATTVTIVNLPDESHNRILYVEENI